MAKSSNRPYLYPPQGYMSYYPPEYHPAPAHSEAPKEPRKASNRKGCTELAVEFALFAIAVLIFIAIMYFTHGGL